MAQLVKNLPTMWETWVQSLGWEDPLEESMVTHSNFLAWRIPMDKGGILMDKYIYISTQTYIHTYACTRARARTHTHTHTYIYSFVIHLKPIP